MIGRAAVDAARPARGVPPEHPPPAGPLRPAWSAEQGLTEDLSAWAVRGLPGSAPLPHPPERLRVRQVRTGRGARSGSPLRAGATGDGAPGSVLAPWSDEVLQPVPGRGCGRSRAGSAAAHAGSTTLGDVGHRRLHLEDRGARVRRPARVPVQAPARRVGAGGDRDAEDDEGDPGEPLRARHAGHVTDSFSPSSDPANPIRRPVDGGCCNGRAITSRARSSPAPAAGITAEFRRGGIVGAGMHARSIHPGVACDA